MAMPCKNCRSPYDAHQEDGSNRTWCPETIYEPDDAPVRSDDARIERAIDRAAVVLNAEWPVKASRVVEIIAAAIRDAWKEI